MTTSTTGSGRPGSPSTIRAGIVGLSWIGADPAGTASSPVLGTAPPYSHASAFEAIGGIDVIAVCDVRDDAVEAFRRRWAPVWPAAAGYTDIDEMLECGLDLVSVVVPDHLHGDVLRRCVDAGVSMIFSEKPFTTDLDEADELLRSIDAAGTTVAVNHTWRWRPDVAETVALVRSGALGPLSQISIQAGGPRAMLFRNLSHFLDLAVHLAGADPVWVAGELEDAPDYGLSYRGDGGTDPRLDPGATALIGFPDDVLAHVSGRKRSSADVVVDVSCLEGRIVIDALGARMIEARRGSDGTPDSVSRPVVSALAPKFTVSGMRAGVADLIDAHRRGSEPSGSARSARTTVAVIDAMLRSNADGNARVALR